MMTTEINKPVTILPPCPYEGCTSDSDHHWHGDSPEPRTCHTNSLCRDADPAYRCYSRPRPRYAETKADGGATRIIWEERTAPTPPLMLSLPTVAKLVEAAMAEGSAK